MTLRFKNYINDLTQSAQGLLINPEDFRLPPELANVLNFLSDHQLEDIYYVHYEHLYNKGDLLWKPGCEIGTMLYERNRAAALNKRKWAATCKGLTDTNRFHWVKALIRYRLRNYSIRKSKKWWVEMDDTKEACVSLAPVPGTSCQLGDISGENDRHDDEPATKKARLGTWF